MTDSDQQAWINTANDHLVGLNGYGQIVLTFPPVTPMPKAEALRLAAWIVALADPTKSQFNKILKAVLNT